MDSEKTIDFSDLTSLSLIRSIINHLNLIRLFFMHMESSSDIDKISYEAWDRELYSIYEYIEYIFKAIQFLETKALTGNHDSSFQNDECSNKLINFHYDGLRTENNVEEVKTYASLSGIS